MTFPIVLNLVASRERLGKVFQGGILSRMYDSLTGTFYSFLVTSILRSRTSPLPPTPVACSS
jgi:hypothetical protein